jgi:predicted phosphodiesterase
MANFNSIGVISDIHGNFEGLLKALEILNKQSIDKHSIYVCGDIVGYGNQPNECCQLIKDLGLTVVAGNHDWAVAGFTNHLQWSDAALRGIEQTLKIIRPEHKDWLASLPLTYYHNDFEIAHSSLEFPEEFMYPAVGMYLAEPWQDVGKTFNQMVGQVCFVGHSHIPTIFLEKGPNKIKAIEPSHPLYKLEDRRAVIDVGSVGLSRRSSGKSSLVVYDQNEHTVQFIRFSVKPLIRL